MGKEGQVTCRKEEGMSRRGKKAWKGRRGKEE
jgi:hypothetical protein